MIVWKMGQMLLCFGCGKHLNMMINIFCCYPPHVSEVEGNGDPPFVVLMIHVETNLHEGNYLADVLA